MGFDLERGSFRRGRSSSNEKVGLASHRTAQVLGADGCFYNTHAFMSLKSSKIIGQLILLFEQSLGRTALNRTPIQVSTVAPAYTTRVEALS